jgi:hypothetical protein
MPLKHRTETLFVTILAIMLLLTGFVLATLPVLPRGIIPWAVVFVFTLLYPAVLMPFYRKERADHEFRSLHWFPMTMAILWLIFATLAWLVPSTAVILVAYTWAWSLPLITFAIIGLLLFCSKVLRQLTKRTVYILGLFIPFAALALWSSSGPRFERSIAKVLWNTSSNAVRVHIPEIPVVANTNIGSTASVETMQLDSFSSTSSVMLAVGMSSSSALTDAENDWKDALLTYTASSESSGIGISSASSVLSEYKSESLEFGSSVSSVERRLLFGFLPFITKTDTIVDIDSSAESSEVTMQNSSVSLSVSSEVVSSASSVIAPSFAASESNSISSVVVVQSASSTPLLIGQNSSSPRNLPNSGLSWSFIVIALLAMYSAMLHKRQVEVGSV